MEVTRRAAERLLYFPLFYYYFEHFTQTSTITILFIKPMKVRNLTCSNFKCHMTISCCVIRALYAYTRNRNKPIKMLSYTRVVFRELHSEKKFRQ